MIIASRILEPSSSDAQKEISIRIFAPVPEAVDWSCRFEIDWPEGTLVRSAVGIDAVQALVLAQQMIGVLLYASDHHRSGDLVWEAHGQGYGFPVPNTVRDLLVGDDKKFF